MNNNAEVIFRNPDNDQRIIIDFENDQENDRLRFNVKIDPPVEDNSQEIGLIGALAEILLTAIGPTNEQV